LRGRPKERKRDRPRPRFRLLDAVIKLNKKQKPIGPCLTIFQGSIGNHLLVPACGKAMPGSGDRYGHNRTAKTTARLKVGRRSKYLKTVDLMPMNLGRGLVGRNLLVLQVYEKNANDGVKKLLITGQILHQL
jgi:hypothetical protein